MKPCRSGMRNLLQAGSTSAQFGFIHSCNQHLPSPLGVLSSEIYPCSLKKKKLKSINRSFATQRATETHTHKRDHIGQQHGTKKDFAHQERLHWAQTNSTKSSVKDNLNSLITFDPQDSGPKLLQPLTISQTPTCMSYSAIVFWEKKLITGLFHRVKGHSCARHLEWELQVNQVC